MIEKELKVYLVTITNGDEIKPTGTEIIVYSEEEAKTIQEVKEIEKKYFQHKIERYKQDIETLECLIENYYVE